MTILSKAREDWKKLSQTALGVDLNFTAKTAETATIKGIATNTTFLFDNLDGVSVPEKDAHFSFAESVLAEENPAYPIRNANQEVAIKGDQVSFLDSANRLLTYEITEAWPDETVGMIVCKVGDRIP